MQIPFPPWDDFGLWHETSQESSLVSEESTILSWKEELKARRARTREIVQMVERVSENVRTQWESAKAIKDTIQDIQSQVQEHLKSWGKKQSWFLGKFDETMRKTPPMKRALVGAGIWTVVPFLGNITWALAGYFYDKLPRSNSEEENIFSQLWSWGLSDLLQKNEEFLSQVGNQGKQIEEVIQSLTEHLNDLEALLDTTQENLKEKDISPKKQEILSNRVQSLQEEKIVVEAQLNNIKSLKTLFRESVSDMAQSFPSAMNHLSLGVISYQTGESVNDISEAGEGIRNLSNTSIQASFEITRQVSETIAKRSQQWGRVLNEETVKKIVKSSQETQVNINKIETSSQWRKSTSLPSAALLALQDLNNKAGK